MLTHKKASEFLITKELRLGKGAVIKINNADNTESEIDLLELAALDSIAAEDLAKIDGITNGTGAANKAVVLDANGGASIPGVMSLNGNVMSTEAGAGITGGTGTVYRSSVIREGGIIKTTILIDLTGLTSADTDLDVIGQGAVAAHLGQITAARNGTIFGGKMTCLEVPSSLTDIDLYSAALGTYVAGDLITDDAAEVALLTAGGAWTAALTRIMTGVPAANQYLYLTNGAADTPDPFTAGKFEIVLYGYAA